MVSEPVYLAVHELLLTEECLDLGFEGMGCARLREINGTALRIEDGRLSWLSAHCGATDVDGNGGCA